MTWFRVDDDLAMHPKVMAAGNAAMGLWVRAGSWAAQHLTDGLVPAHIAKTLGTNPQIKRLIEAGLWTQDEDGNYRFHQWNPRQPTKTEVLNNREKRASAGRLGGIRSGESRREANASALASSKNEPRPVPSRLSVLTVVRHLQQVDAHVSDDDVIQWRQDYPGVDLDAEAAAWLDRHPNLDGLSRPVSAWKAWLGKAVKRAAETPTPPSIHALCDHGRGPGCPHCRQEATA